MNKINTPIITAGELKTLLVNEKPVIIDARNSRDQYEASHIHGAIHVSLDQDLADIKEDLSNGGRHPLPELSDFAALLSKLGITPESRVVVYDDMNGANAAARFWWMLRAIGHENVQVLSGGFQEAVKEEIPIGDEKVFVSTIDQQYPFTEWRLPIAHLKEVKGAAQSDDHVVIDVRAAARYRGEVEPIDIIAGHIPGAINIPLTENLDDQGLFLAPEQLKEKYEGIFESNTPDHVIVHCGSGVTACHTLLAMNHAGYEIPKLYVGSWSEWSRHYLPIGTGKD